MRDARPFVLDILVRGERRTEILMIQIIVELAHPFRRQHTAVFDFLVRQHFKFREHRLAEQGRAEFLDIVVDEVSAHGFVRFLVEQMVHQQ